MKKEQTPICKLKPGVRIKLLSLLPCDGHYANRENLINKVYESISSEYYYSTAFKQEGTNHIYVFVAGATYKKLKKELV